MTTIPKPAPEKIALSYRVTAMQAGCSVLDPAPGPRGEQSASSHAIGVG